MPDGPPPAALPASARLLVAALQRLPGAAWLALADGAVAFVNAAWGAGSPAAGLAPALQWHDALHPDDAPRVLAARAAALAAAGELHVTARLRTAGGGHAWHALTETALPAEPASAPLRLGTATPIQDAAAPTTPDETAALHRLLDAIPVALLVSDEQTHFILHANAAATAQLGWPREALSGMRIDELCPEGGRAAQAAGDAATPGAAAPCAVLAADGTRREVLAARQRCGFVDRPAVLTAIWDITAQRATQRDLQASDQRLQAAMQAAGFGTMDANLDSGQVVASPGFRALVGLEAADTTPITLDRLRSLIAPDARADVIAGTEQAARDGSITRREITVVRADTGERRMLASWGHVSRDARGQRHWVGVQRDVTELAALLASLAESEERLRITLEAAGAGSVALDVETGEAVLSAEVFRLLGLPPGEGGHINLAALHPLVEPADLPGAIAALKAAQPGAPLTRRYRIRRADTGEVRWMEQIGRVRADQSGRRRLFAIQRDVTERVRSEAAQALAEERARLTLEAAQEVTWDWSVATGTAWFCERLAPLLGRPPGGAGQHGPLWPAGIHPDDRVAARRRLEAHLSGDTHAYEAEYRLRRADGGYVWVLDRGRVVARDAEGRPLRMVGTLMEITARKVAEEALAASEARLRLALEAAGAGHVDADLETGEMLAAPQVFRILGIAPPRDGCTSLASMRQHVHPEDRDAAFAQSMDAPPGKTLARRYRILRADTGELRWVESLGRVHVDRQRRRRWSGIQRDVTEQLRTQAALEESEQRLRLALESAEAGMFDTDLDSGEVVASRRTFEMLGLPVPADGRTRVEVLRERIHPADAVRNRAQLRAARTGETLQRRFRIHRADTGEERWVESVGRIVIARGGQRRWFGIQRDVTERLRMEAALAESEQRLRLAIEAADSGIIDADLDTGEAVVSPSILEMSGLPARPDGRLPLATLRSSIHPDDLTEIVATTDAAGPGERLQRRLRVIRADNGALRWVERLGSIMQTPDGHRRLLAIQRDVTRLVETEQALADSEERLRLALEATGFGIWDVDLATGMSTWSLTMFALQGLPPEPPGTGLTRLWVGRIHPADRHRVLTARDAAVERGQLLRTGYRICRPDGQEVRVESQGRVMQGADGRRRFVGIMQDVSAIHAAESALAASEAQLRLAIEGVGFATWELDLETGANRWSEGHFTLFGYPPDASGRASLAMWRDRVHPDDIDAAHDAWAQAEAGDGIFQHGYRVVWPDGTTVWVEGYGRFIAGADGRRRFVGVCHDVTARKTAELALAASEARLRVVQDAVPECIKLVDAAGHLLFINRAGAEMAGVAAPASLVGCLVAPMIVPADRDAFAACIAGTCAGEAGQVEYEAQGEGGARIRLEMRTSPLRLPDGRIVALCVSRDVTQRRAAEAGLRAAQAEAMRTSRLNAVGAMALGIAHELNQPLGALANYASAAALVLERAATDATAAGRARGLLDRLAEQAVRAGDIVRRLREFVARGETEPRTLRAAALIDEALAAARAALRVGGIDLQAEPPAETCEVFADRVQVNQVLANLIRNAIEAVGDRPRRQVRVSARRAPQGGVEFAVADTGPGLSPLVEARLFEPFVSGKPDGMGVGLAICRTIVEAHGGHIWVEAAAGGGTVFRFVLPDAEVAATA